MRPADLATAVRVRAELASDAARESREAAGVTAADIARVVGVSRQSVSSWESGSVVPTVAHALAYGRALAALTPKAA
jgi:DNA-binding XRE family transcriptional regulator